MNTGSIIKWGLIIVAAWFVLQWLSNYFNNDMSPIPGGSIYGSGWAAPLVGPGQTWGWTPPYPMYPGYRSKRFGPARNSPRAIY
jgi:hypothetical protein